MSIYYSNTTLNTLNSAASVTSEASIYPSAPLGSSSMLTHVMNTHINEMETQFGSINIRSSSSTHSKNLLQNAWVAIKDASKLLYFLLPFWMTLALAISLVADYDYLLSNPFADPNLRTVVYDTYNIFLKLLSSDFRYIAICKD